MGSNCEMLNLTSYRIVLSKNFYCHSGAAKILRGINGSALCGKNDPIEGNPDISSKTGTVQKAIPVFVLFVWEGGGEQENQQRQGIG